MRELPEGWSTTPLNALSVRAIGGDWGKDSAAEVENAVRVAVVRSTEYRDWDRNRARTAAIRFVKRSSLEARRLEKGDLVVEVSGGGPSQPVGRVALIDEKALASVNDPLTCSNFCRKLRLHRLVDSGFVALALKQLYWIGGLELIQTHTTNLRNLDFNEFLKLELPLAPVAEQKRIVAKVETLLAEIDAARERLEKVPAILKRFRQSVLAAACSGRLTDDWRSKIRSVETGDQLLDRILSERRKRFTAGVQARSRSGTIQRSTPEFANDFPELPKDWTWARWNDLADWITYGFTRPMPHVATGVPIVTARHVVNSRIDFDNVDWTTEKAFAELSEKDRPRPGEILMTKDGSIGRAAVVKTNKPFCINQSVAVVRFGGLSGNPEFLRLAIESPFTQKLIDERAKGSAIRHISITAFGEFPVPLPPLSEQNEIVKRVVKFEGIATAVENHWKHASIRVNRLGQSIFAKAFRGELVQTEAELARAEGREYESADQLLARIWAERAAQEPVKVGKRKKGGNADLPRPARARRRAATG